MYNIVHGLVVVLGLLAFFPMVCGCCEGWFIQLCSCKGLRNYNTFWLSSRRSCHGEKERVTTSKFAKSPPWRSLLENQLPSPFLKVLTNITTHRNLYFKDTR